MATRRELIRDGGLFSTVANAVGGSLTTGLTALAGGGQTGATLLTGVTNIIGTCATGGDSCMLPLADAGDEIFVRNNGAASCNVFPQSGGKINGGSANAQIAVANAKTAVFKAIGPLDWIAVVSA